MQMNRPALLLFTAMFTAAEGMNRPALLLFTGEVHITHDHNRSLTEDVRV